MSGPEMAIPYTGQSDPHTNRMCGAACLSMVYGSFGQEVAQAAIWPAIAKESRSGSLASSTHLMTRDALRRGFGALAIQARHPLQALRLCRDSGIRAIVNLRLRHDAPTGHYAVLVDIDDTKVLLHDPYFGPSRPVSHAELLELWHPRAPGSEIVGNVLIGVAVGGPGAQECRVCHAPMPSRVECPRCRNPVALEPHALLGCMSSACVARMWSYICCPACDYTWTFELEPAPVGGRVADSGSRPLEGPRVATGRADDPLDLAGLFCELDKFCSHILSLPGAASHPDVKAQLDFISGSKEMLRLAQTEALAHMKKREEQLAAVAKVAEHNQAAHRKRVEDLARPSPPLDGNALGRALLKKLGLTE